MRNSTAIFNLSFVFLLTASVVPTLADESVLETAPQSSMECGGHYECRDDRPLTPQATLTSIEYPQAAASQEQAHAARLAAHQQLDAEPSLK